MIPIIDMHCDTVSKIKRNQVKAAILKEGIAPDMSFFAGMSFDDTSIREDLNMKENALHIDFKRLKEAGYMCQSFAFFVWRGDTEKAGKTPFEYMCEQSCYLDEQTGESSDLIRGAYSGSDIERNHKEGYVSALKTVEDAWCFEGSLDKLKAAYDMGIRKSTITWNYENELGYPNTDPGGDNFDTERGLKPCGFEFVHAMEDMGIIMDISHLNDAGIKDIFDTVRPGTPVIASHSNARALANVSRNLSDEMIKAISNHGGVTGINFYPGFLVTDSGVKASLEDMVRHMRYIADLGGIDMVALGSDLDGINGDLPLSNCLDVPKLADIMSCRGFTDDDIEKVFYKNALRVYKEVLG